MTFFRNFPVTIGHKNVLLTDITARIDFDKFHWLKHPDSYYDYIYKDGDKLDSIADRYYSDPNLYWVILVSNGILNPYFELPLLPSQFDKYLLKKYRDKAINAGMTAFKYVTEVYDEDFSYQKIVTIKDSNTGEIVSQDYFILDKTSYDEVIEYTSEFTSNKVKYLYKVEKNIPIPIYEWEYELNEKKRNIKILKKELINDAIFLYRNVVKAS